MNMVESSIAQSAGFDRLRALAARLRTINWKAYSWLLMPLAIFAVTRLAVFIAAVVGDVLLPTAPGHWDPAPGQPLAGLWARWDSQWYEWIIQEGYWLRPGQRSNVAFFPLYPLLVKGLMPLTGNSSLLAGFIISNVSFLLALVFLYRLTELEFGNGGTAARAVLYIAVFPTSFFFSMFYTESLFLLLVVAAVYFGRRHLWVWAVLMGIMATATRIVGVLVIGILVWEWLRVHGWTLETIHHRQSWRNLGRGLRRDWLTLLILFLIPAGLLSYMVFLQMEFRDALAFQSVQIGWGRVNVGPLAVVLEDLRLLVNDGLTAGNIARILNLGTVALTLFTVPFIWRRLGAGYALYVLLALLIPLSSGSQSILRYALVSFPLFMMFASWGRWSLFDRSYTVLCTTLLGVFTATFVNWYFVA